MPSITHLNIRSTKGNLSDIISHYHLPRLGRPFSSHMGRRQNHSTARLASKTKCINTKAIIHANQWARAKREKTKMLIKHENISVNLV